MERSYIEDQVFEKIRHAESPLEQADYEGCTFVSCDFSGADLGEFRFIDCLFKACNLSMAGLDKTSFQEVEFSECKMLGLRFEHCNPLGMSFSFGDCQLNHSSFYSLKLPRVRFIRCLLQEADFTGTDLSGAVLDECDLSLAVFENTLLEKADLSTAMNYSLDPEDNYIRGAKFSLPAVTGLLYKYQIEIL
jgi:fluoroquinolone resistance protein